MPEAAPARPRFPFPIPNGWFCVALSEELEPGAVLAVRYFARELVVWRDEAGDPHVFDAFCPHLGAHLGHGGSVVENTLRCPFHAWRFEGSGRCVEVPYARRIPPKAQVATLPCVERNGLILAWRHAEGAPPAWEIPILAEYGDPAWTPFDRREWTVRSCNQELAENSVDPAHFRYVHKTNTVPATEVSIDGHLLHATSASKVGTPKGEAEGHIDIQAHGFGFGFTRFSGVVDLLVMTGGTPIDAEHVHMRLAFSVRKLATSDATQGVGRAFIAEIERQFSEDIPIWENKAHLERPLLCDGDGPIGLLRRWARQFYSEGRPG